MIIVQLTGGLGNQLFQYAMGRRLALKNNTILKLDLSFFESYEWHEYSIGPFCLDATIATKEEVEELKKKNNSYFERIKRRLFKTLPIVIEEKKLLYDDYYLNAGRNTYLLGYWQCERYFMPIENKLRKELRIKEIPSVANQKLLEAIQGQEQSVSLHIRRGNFVSVDFVNKAHGTTSLDYYHQAISLIEERLEKPVFYIFSDEIKWAKENIKLPHEHIFVDINDDKTDFEDLRLMFSCKHHILANSTFSWWGAWLNTNPNKMVFAPKQWFADEKRNSESLTIIPDSWTRI